MIRLKDTRFGETNALMARAVGVAEYYGFTNVDHLAKQTTRAPFPKVTSPAQLRNESGAPPAIVYIRKEERILMQSVRQCLARFGSETVNLTWRVTTQSSPNPQCTLELHVVGLSSTFSEALVVIVADAIAREIGISQRTLAINNVGSTEASGRFVRDVGNFLRKHIESISTTLRPRAAIDPLGTLIQLIERGHPAVSRAPQPMEYLNEEERRRFWEFLEYLEAFGLSYELNGRILGSRDFWNQTLFEISYQDTETGIKIPFVFGGRYDPLASRVSRQPKAAVVANIMIELHDRHNSLNDFRMKWPSDSANAPAIYFAHLGIEARRRALPLLETLRQAAIPVRQSLWQDRIGDQMTIANDLATPYVLIMGHKEAMEGSILVREVSTNSQANVPIDDLVGYLKRRRIGTRIVQNS